MKIHEFVRQFVKLGIAIIPLYHRSKIPCLPSWERFTHELNTEYQLESWFPTNWLNYAVIAGWCNLVILDFDNLFHFELWRDFMFASSQRRVFETSFKVITSKGMHVYLRTEQPSANDKRISIRGGIDIQAASKYVVGPGCTHPNGTQYIPVGEMNFPVVENIATILPLDLFPRVAPEQIYNGAPIAVTPHTQYQCDPVTDTRDLISKVKSSVRIESLFSGVQRSSTDGRWLKALCPFHPDQHQSAWIDTLRQLAGCQVCGMRPMDVVNVFARMRNLNVSAAVVALAEECGVWR
jgi:hypothetical protein